MIPLAIPAISALFGLFGKHGAAVKNEAAALADVTGQATKFFQQLFSNVSSGAVTKEQAAGAVDSLFPVYEDAVYKQYKVKKKSGNGPDKIEAQLKNWATSFKSWLNGGESVTLEALQKHGDYKGQSAITLTGAAMQFNAQAQATTNTTGLSSDYAGWDSQTLPGTAEDFFISTPTGYKLPAGFWTWVVFGVIALIVFKMARR